MVAVFDFKFAKKVQKKSREFLTFPRLTLPFSFQNGKTYSKILGPENLTLLYIAFDGKLIFLF